MFFGLEWCQIEHNRGRTRLKLAGTAQLTENTRGWDTQTIKSPSRHPPSPCHNGRVYLHCLLARFPVGFIVSFSSSHPPPAKKLWKARVGSRPALSLAVALCELSTSLKTACAAPGQSHRNVPFYSARIPVAGFMHLRMDAAPGRCCRRSTTPEATHPDP